MTPTNQSMAQAIYLAQLEAAQSGCKCKTCQILRKANSTMVNEFLAPQPQAPSTVPVEAIDINPLGTEENTP